MFMVIYIQIYPKFPRELGLRIVKNCIKLDIPTRIWYKFYTLYDVDDFLIFFISSYFLKW